MVELRIAGGEVEILAWEDFEERVLAGRIPDSAEVRIEAVTGDAFVRAGELDLVTSLRNAEHVAWRRRFEASGPPILTMLLVGFQIRIWMAAQVPGLGEWLAGYGMNWLPPALEDGQMWRIPTSGLLHTDFLHVLLNMVWMAYTGWNLERALGRANVAAIFFFSVFVGGLLSMFLSPGNPSLGASGGVYGLVAASVVFGFVRHDILPEKSRILFGAALAPYLILMFFSGLSNARTDNWAHFGGILAGCALAFVLDPPGFDHRRRNRVVQIGGTVVMVAVLLGLAVTGPWVHPLVDQEQARLDAMPRAVRSKRVGLDDLLTDLDFRVPAGWKPGVDAAGETAFRSPAHTDRSLSVVVKEGREPKELGAFVDLWKNRLAGQDATFTEEEATWQDLPARRVVATLRDGERLELLATVRGAVGLQRVFGYPKGEGSRLATLYDRVERSIDWQEPIALQNARRNAHATPNGVKARTDLAMELARWGELDEALRIQRELVDERPIEVERWQGLFAITAWSGGDLVDLADQALAVEPFQPTRVVAVASALDEVGETTAAHGLIELAWFRVPGDRDLKRALRRADLPFQITPAGEAWQLVNAGPSPRDPAQIEALRTGPLSVERAQARGEQARQERQALSATFDPAGPDAVQTLLTIRDGGSTPYFDKPKRLRRQLSALASGHPPSWMDATLQQRLSDPAVLEALRERVDDLVDPE